MTTRIDSDIRIRGEASGPPIVQLPRFLQRIRQKFGLADSIGSLTVNAGIIATDNVTPVAVDDYYLEGTRIAGRAVDVAAVAAQFGAVAVVNPIDSGYVLIPRFAGIRLPTDGGSVGLALASVITGLLTVDQIEVPTDTRWNSIDAAAPLGSTAGKTISGTSASALGQDIRALAPGAAAAPLPFVIFPGWAMYVRATTVNVQFIGSLEWIERPFTRNEVDLSRGQP